MLEFLGPPPAAPAPRPVAPGILSFLGPGATIAVPDQRPAPRIPAEFMPSGIGRPPVSNSEDLERVAALPRRPRLRLTRDRDGRLDDPAVQAIVDYMNGLLRRPDWQRTNCKCSTFRRDCILSLTPAQAWALYEIMHVGGLFGLLATGSGKTAVGFLSPLVAPSCKLAVGLLPANLVEQLVREYELWREHWQVPMLVYGKGQWRSVFDEVRRAVPRDPWPTLHAVSYEKLSAPDSTNLFKSLCPTWVYTDEADKLAAKDSARTGRFLRQFADIPHTRYAGWTGTPWDKSILEVQHLMALALRGGSPLPIDPAVAKEWALAIDPGDRPTPPGALRRFCGPQAGGPRDEELVDAFHRRLVETVGVVATQESAINIPLNLMERIPRAFPQSVKDMLNMVRAFERPDGEELVDALEVARVACEVMQGFYYRWVFPDMPRDAEGKLTAESKALIGDWLARRKAWRKELREKRRDQQPYLDSDKLCEDAAARHYAGYQGELPTWAAESYPAWVEVRDKVRPETEPVWVDDYLVRDAAEWTREHLGVVWYKHDAFGERLGQLTGLPVHRGGPDAEERIQAERGDRPIIASIKAHGRGRDGLQYLFHEQLVVVPPSSGRMSEQLLARLHRVGQKRPEVNTWAYRHVYELACAFDQAFTRAEFASSTWGAAQKLLNANCDWR